MARFLILGSLALDRIFYLNDILKPGARLRAVSPQTNIHSNEIRLGGAAANSGTVLVNAGHDVLIASAISNSEKGDQIQTLANQAGLDLRFVQSITLPKGDTLIFIEPTGERTIIGVWPDQNDFKTKYQQAVQNIKPLKISDLAPLSLNGIFIRTPLPGVSEVTKYLDCPVMTHYPYKYHTPIYADIIVCSEDDIDHETPQTALESVQTVSTERLKYLVVTQGAHGGYAVGPDKTVIRYKSPAVKQVDSTGAGDCFAAGLLEAISLGADMPSALHHAAKWGAITASRYGSSITKSDQTYPSFGDDNLARNRAENVSSMATQTM